MKRIHSNEIHYTASIDEIMTKLKIPNKKSTDLIYVSLHKSGEFITFKQIEQVD